MPPQIAGGFTDAMSQSLWLPVIGFAIGAVLVLFFSKPKVTVDWEQGNTPGMVTLTNGDEDRETPDARNGAPGIA